MDERRLERLLAALHRTDDEASVLDRICSVCVHEASVDRAGLSRLGSGRHEVLAASGRQADLIENLQVTSAEGPCLDAIRGGRFVREPDLASATALERWPDFATAAVAHGVSAVFAFPLLTTGVAIGALDVFSHRPGELQPAQYDDAVLLADLAALAVSRQDATASIAGTGIGTEPTEPWAHPAVVHQASGMVAAQLDITVDDALMRLRAVGFVSGIPVADVARDVVARKIRLESWSGCA